MIDGQQRLTTLVLILKYYTDLGNINLSFDHRNETNQILNTLNNNKITFNNSIEYGFKFIKEKFTQDKGLLINDFKKYFKNNVIILLTEVPKETDLNHYFEIMNNRGEQLEKTDILKARLMSRTNVKKHYAFSKIWEACSNMDNYAILNIKNNRESLFGKYLSKIPDDIEKVIFSFNSNENTELKTIEQLLKNNTIKETAYTDDNIDISDERFSAIIDFPNFLLHTLKIYLNNENVSLNDKDLISQFEKYQKKIIPEEFILCLLKTRLLFDRFIIKSNNNNEKIWTLKGIKKYSKNYQYLNSFGVALSDNKSTIYDDEKISKSKRENNKEQIEIIQLLSMFTVSFRQNIYKNWLYEILNYLNTFRKYKEITSREYLNFLENLAAKYAKLYIKDKILNNGLHVPHYIFNYLDYLLWKDNNTLHIIHQLKQFNITKESFYFNFTWNSVEHYYPQNNACLLKKRKYIDYFGNLCLISHSQNSSSINKTTREKKECYRIDHIKKTSRLKCYSIKQVIIFQEDNWDQDAIIQHRKDMRNILENAVNDI